MKKDKEALLSKVNLAKIAVLLLINLTQSSKATIVEPIIIIRLNKEQEQLIQLNFKLMIVIALS